MQQLKRDGHSVPALDNKPEIGPDFFYWSAFTDLTTCRAWGDIPGPIPWTAIKEYANRAGFNDVDFNDLNYVIRQLDDVYLTEWHKKRKQELLKHERSTASYTNSRR